MSYWAKLFLCLSMVSCSSLPTTSLKTSHEDPYLWLEEIESPKSLEFAKNENEKTFSILKNDPNFKDLEADLRK
ncbi:MAG: hypothetical protein K2Q18_10540, partial [Bdellovibrionales bacterium]|nr:hypothetical protein [Bdellovibrionales bacterium]